MGQKESNKDHWKLDEERRKKLVSAVKYAGLAFQLFVTIVVAVLIGRWIDRMLELEKPIFTALLIPVFLFGFIYRLYLEINKES
ncbi:MAG: AtpZ/AtpI family protein [Saprospirales bacterium]|nr:MAG: AtpZ/AtpI family protein [Saprospirales bacterium]